MKVLFLHIPDLKSKILKKKKKNKKSTLNFSIFILDLWSFFIER